MLSGNPICPITLKKKRELIFWTQFYFINYFFFCVIYVCVNGKECLCTRFIWLPFLKDNWRWYSHKRVCANQQTPVPAQKCCCAGFMSVYTARLHQLSLTRSNIGNFRSCRCWMYDTLTNPSIILHGIPFKRKAGWVDKPGLLGSLRGSSLL
jgi:hypothetical protein